MIILEENKNHIQTKTNTWKIISFFDFLWSFWITIKTEESKGISIKSPAPTVCREREIPPVRADHDTFDRLKR